MAHREETLKLHVAKAYALQLETGAICLYVKKNMSAGTKNKTSDGAPRPHNHKYCAYIDKGVVTSGFGCSGVAA